MIRIKIEIQKITRSFYRDENLKIRKIKSHERISKMNVKRIQVLNRVRATYLGISC